jgi:hypothetical protein
MAKDFNYPRRLIRRSAHVAAEIKEDVGLAILSEELDQLRTQYTLTRARLAFEPEYGLVTVCPQPTLHSWSG